jgi:hypothetical protein
MANAFAPIGNLAVVGMGETVVGVDGGTGTRQLVPPIRGAALFKVTSAGSPGAAAATIKARAWDGVTEPAADEPETYIAAQQGHEVGDPIVAEPVPGVIKADGTLEREGNSTSPLVVWQEKLRFRPVGKSGMYIGTIDSHGRLGPPDYIRATLD